MTHFQAFLLAILQGATEFLPISSSGHLVLVERLWKLQEPNLFYDVVIHVGTLLATVIVLWRPIVRLLHFALADSPGLMRKKGLRAAWYDSRDGRLILAVIAATIPTALIGFLGKDYFEKMFMDASSLGWQFLVTGFILCLTFLRKPPAEDSPAAAKPISLWVAFLVGIAQGAAIIPAISRSGATITVALLLGLSRSLSWEFSFLISIPSILGALILQAGELGVQPAIAPSVLALGFLVSFLSGWVFLILLRRFVQHGIFGFFSIYCFALGAWCIYYFR